MMNAANKVVSLDQLVEIRARAVEQRVVHFHGVFQAIHPGVIEFLTRARALGDLLIVSLPIDHGADMTDVVAALNELACVDALYLDLQPTPQELLAALKPHLYVKPAEFRGVGDPQLATEMAQVAANGGQCTFLPCPAAGAIGNRGFRALCATTAERQVEPALSGMRDEFQAKRIVVVGDYVRETDLFCNQAETSGSTLALQPAAAELFDCGAAAIARHLAALGAMPTLVTCLADDEHSQQAEIRLKNQGILLSALRNRRDLPEHTRHFVAGEAKFDLRTGTIRPLASNQEAMAVELLARACVGSAAIIFADYGYGMLNPSVIQKFIAVAKRNGAAAAFVSSGPAVAPAQGAGMDLIYATERQIRNGTSDQTSSLDWLLASFAKQAPATRVLCESGQSALLALDNSDRPTASGGQSKLCVIPRAQSLAANLRSRREASFAAAVLALSCGAGFTRAASAAAAPEQFNGVAENRLPMRKAG